jgi:hypothetical protein
LTFRTRTVLDTRINNATATITVTAVPEPAGLVLVGTGLLGMAAVRFRARRAHATRVPEPNPCLRSES